MKNIIFFLVSVLHSVTRAPYMPGLQKLVREGARRCRGIQPRNVAVLCIFALSRRCRPRYSFPALQAPHRPSFPQ
jgi:hypothetical protein